ncbi:histidinol-phosphate transaminase [Teichococcus vastitatis]|uniref:Histidinol-phosphate aminotransferase n=1 Tax=Teichococcus vastitatis TaxID=2307076 RepID=A0ABS9W5Q8_9PROT|nr:histidinol-phosphate transaminase [Pseudoroseomonas vastitatis]MCI0754621.1 histidinol-phosphate transaminase [Pseudoroseomonas vastitatis]
MSVAPRPSILSIDPYVGGESKIPGVNRIIKLSSNEGAFGPPPAAIEAITRAAREAHRYPDGNATALREALGARFGLDPARIVTGNGSDELISLLCLAYGGEGTEFIMSAYGFMMYDISGRAIGSRVLKVAEKPAPEGGGTVADIDAMIAAAGPRTRIVFLTNPNNPTGALLPNSEVARLRAGLRDDILLVLDSAYAEYVTEPSYDPGHGLVDAAGNTIMLRTFSKVFGLGGMRVGWGYAPADVIDVLNRVRGPFNVASASMAAAIGALAEPGWVEKSVAHNTEWRGRLATALRAAGGDVWPSHANFLLADFGTAGAARAVDAKLKTRGLIVRGMGGYGLPQALRFTVGNAEECQLLIDALGAPSDG